MSGSFSPVRSEFPLATAVTTVTSLVPRITSAPDSSSSCCGQNEVVIQLSTALLIPDYHRFYDTPITQFQPSYTPLADGSLVTQPFIDDIINANINLLVVGILTMLFARNIFVSGDYIRRATFKQNFLFYVLFGSQLLACLAFIPILVSQFNQSSNCRVVSILSFVSTAFSVTLLILWILGYKAYRCLNRSRVLMGILILFFCASAATVVLEVVNLKASHRLSGSCIRTSDLHFTKIYIMLQLAESLFICCCFCMALWRSRGSPLARGRISIQLSMEMVEQKTRSGSSSWNRQCGLRDLWVRRGATVATSPEPLPMDGVEEEKAVPDLQVARSPSKQLRPKPSLLQISEPNFQRQDGQACSSIDERGRSSPVPSTFSRYFPRMELFRQVMRDELCYTTFITGSCVVVAVFALIGVNFKNGLTVDGWISINWSIISLLAIHSFGRVVRRHERDTILKEPETWHTINRSHQPSALNDCSRSFYSSNYTTKRRPWRRAEIEGHCSETCRLTASRQSWDSSHSSSSFGSGISPILSYSPHTLMPPPSLLIDDFPSSGRTTPLVAHNSGDGTLFPEFRQSLNSWTDDRTRSVDAVLG